jgi:aspartyl-tRNA synthetase
MMAGFDRYYQIARCFRDEACAPTASSNSPSSTWSSPSSATRRAGHVEDMIREVFKEVVDVELDAFPRMTWAEAMRRYGSDKPDLRIALELVDVAELVKDSEFKVFTDPANDADGRVAALRIPGGASLSRKQIDEYAAHAAKYGAKGLAYVKIDEAGAVNSPIQKFFARTRSPRCSPTSAPATATSCSSAPVRYKKVSDFMGALRLKAGKDFGLVADGWKPLWVTDFPMFEWDDEEQRYVALHHPSPRRRWTTSPTCAPTRRPPSRAATTWCSTATRSAAVRSASTVRRCRARCSTCSASARRKRAKFGFLLDALNYGAPPHGGIAFGIDRIAALMAGTESIRDVIPFPKTTGAQDLMTDAPSPIVDAQLAEVHIQVRPKTN